jgi:hypothetical protein
LYPFRYIAVDVIVRLLFIRRKVVILMLVISTEVPKSVRIWDVAND